MSDALVVTGNADDVLSRVIALVPVLRERARATEQARHMLPENLTALVDAGVFRLTMPRDHGGYEAPFALVSDVLSEIARGCPSTGWIASIFCAAASWPAMLSDEAADEIYSTPDLRISALIATTATAVPVEGGVRLTGRWGWNTGGRHSQWAGVAANHLDGDTSEPVVCLVPTQVLEISDDWDAAGMAGTATNSTSADDVFVPGRRVVPIAALASGRYPHQGRYAANNYFRYPAVQLFLALSTPAFVGIARGAMDVWRERIGSRGITGTIYTSQAEAPSTQLALADAARDLRCAELFAVEAIRSMEKNAGGTPSPEDRILTKAYLGWCAKHAQSCVNTLYRTSGASAVQNAVPIQRYWRDVNTLIQHALIDPTTSDELYGRSLLGVDTYNTSIF
ncbi:acyl-CoA dehydrogenase family protein [Pseudonocardia sp. CA-142604]|uniref:acyl-CoA dehydrogenase family protein n=1 Tax=Pseudonocardia sp. CA-142604 TaxID=3240024 RepID=UPI003D8E0830